MRKPKVLFVSEASYLASGYAVYANEVLSRLYKSNKVDIVEFATFGDENNVDSLPIKWEFVGNLPNQNNPREVKKYDSNMLNKFGQWKFEEVCLKYKPDIVFDYKDWWYMEYQSRIFNSHKSPA